MNTIPASTVAGNQIPPLSAELWRKDPTRRTDCENIYDYSRREHIFKDTPRHIENWINWLRISIEGHELISCISYLRKEPTNNYKLMTWPSDQVPWAVTITGPQINLRCVMGKTAQPHLKYLVQTIDGPRSTNLFHFIDYIIKHKKRPGYDCPSELFDMLTRFRYMGIRSNQHILSDKTLKNMVANPKIILWNNLHTLLREAWMDALADGRLKARDSFLDLAKKKIHVPIMSALVEIQKQRDQRQNETLNKLVFILGWMGTNRSSAMYSYRQHLNPSWYNPKRYNQFNLQEIAKLAREVRSRPGRP